jgi:hypothetical protein
MKDGRLIYIDKLIRDYKAETNPTEKEELRKYINYLKGQERMFTDIPQTFI